MGNFGFIKRREEKRFNPREEKKRGSKRGGIRVYAEKVVVYQGIIFS